MSIDEIIEELEDSKDYPASDPASDEALDGAVNIMRKYQKIEQIMKSKKMDALNIGLLIPKDMACVLHEIKEVLEDGKIN